MEYICKVKLTIFVFVKVVKKPKTDHAIMKDAAKFLKGKERVNITKKDFDKVILKGVKNKKG